MYLGVEPLTSEANPVSGANPDQPEEHSFVMGSKHFHFKRRKGNSGTGGAEGTSGSPTAELGRLWIITHGGRDEECAKYGFLDTFILFDRIAIHGYGQA